MSDDIDLKQKSISGIKWNTMLSLAAAGLQLVTLFALARLLSPVVWGLMGMFTVVVGFAQNFADMGISNAVIHKQNVEQGDLSSLFWLNVLAGVVISAAICAFTPLITALYHEPDLAGPLYLSSLAFLIAPMGQLSQVLLQKELCFRSLAIIQLLGTVTNSIMSVLLAVMGLGVYSIICGQLASTILQAALLGYRARNIWKPRCYFSCERVKRYMSFGLYQMGERTVSYFNANLDYLLIGTLLGTEKLGYYSLAYSLVLRPSQIINPIVTKVAFPVFSRIQNDAAKMRNGYLKMLRYVSIINCPIMTGLAATAPYAIDFLGPKWLPSLVLIQILTVVGLLRSLVSPVGSLLLAKGRAGLGFKWNAGITFIQIPGLYLGAKLGGSVGVALAFALLMVIYTVAAYPVLISPVLEPCLAACIRSIFPAIWKSMIMGMIVLMTGSIMHGFPSIFVVCAQILVGVGIYLGLICTMEKEIIVEVKALWYHQTPAVSRI